MRLLLVEDEAKTLEALRQAFTAESYEVDAAATGEEGFFLASSRRYDLILLDIMLPGRDGFEVLAALRGAGCKSPVLVLTARDAVDDRVKGLDLGADDYLVKPFAVAEVLARARALLRRGRPDDVLRLKALDLEMDLLTHRVTRGGRALDLTAREFDLLEYLLRNKGHAVSREMLAKDVWKEEGRLTPITNVIDVHVAHLRRKVDDPFERKLVQTVRGVGYCIEEGA